MNLKFLLQLSNYILESESLFLRVWHTQKYDETTSQSLLFQRKKFFFEQFELPTANQVILKES